MRRGRLGFRRPNAALAPACRNLHFVAAAPGKLAPLEGVEEAVETFPGRPKRCQLLAERARHLLRGHTLGIEYLVLAPLHAAIEIGEHAHRGAAGFETLTGDLVVEAAEDPGEDQAEPLLLRETLQLQEAQ